MKIRLSALDRFLQRAERAIALLDRCRPLNYREESARVLRAWQGGSECTVRFVYPASPDLSELRARLLLIARGLSASPGIGALYAERALELESEAQTAESIGTPVLCAAARRRYPVAAAEQQRAAETAKRLVERAATVARQPSPTHRSDDDADPGSLVSCLRRRVGSLRLPVRVEVVPDLVSTAAATNDGRLWIRAGAEHTDVEVERLVVHELEGHVLPRLRARTESLGLFAVGTAQGSEDEEGRALLLEERAGVLDARRGFELGLRHRAAWSVREGADFVETARALLDTGALLPDALQITARVCRGGGLAREIVYLPAYLRVRDAFSGEPELERWLERGRISVRAARCLEGLGQTPELLEIEEPLTLGNELGDQAVSE